MILGEVAVGQRAAGRSHASPPATANHRKIKEKIGSEERFYHVNCETSGLRTSPGSPRSSPRDDVEHALTHCARAVTVPRA